MMVRLARKRIALGAGPDAFVSSITTDDAAAAVVAALSAPAGIYNVGDDEPVTRRDFFGSLGQCPRRAPALYRSGGAVQAGREEGVRTGRSQRVSNAHFRQATGWSPAYPSVRQGWPMVVAALQSQHS